MKSNKYLFFAIVFLFIKEGYSQQFEALTLSNSVLVEGYSSETLFQNAYSYFTSGNRNWKKDPDVTVKDKHLISMDKESKVYSNSISRHPLGKINYTYTVEVKDNKYRYRYSEMIFTPFERNRYGKFIATSGKRYNVNSIIANKKFRYRNDILRYVNSYVLSEAEQLHRNMLLTKESAKSDW